MAMPFRGGRRAESPRDHARFYRADRREPKAEIGRLDFEFTADKDSNALSGSATLYLVPLDADPLDEDGLKDGRRFDITTERVE